MPIAKFQFPDGRVGRFEVPEGTTPEQAQSMIQAQISQTPAEIIKNKTTTLAQDLWQGFAKDPATAAAQIGANIRFADNPEARQAVNEQVSADDPGFSVGRMVGNMINPVNAGAGFMLNALGKTAKGITAARAAGVSAPAGMLSAPVTDGDFLEGKGAQAAASVIGAAVGQKAGNALGNILATRQAANGLRDQAYRATIAGQGNNQQTIYNTINQVLKQEGLPEFAMMPQEVQTNLTSVANQIQQAMQKGKSLDAAALTRQALGRSVMGDDAGLMLGQATRDPLQWAREYNLKGIELPGANGSPANPIASRLQTQNQRLINAIRSNGIEDPYNAGTVAGKALKDLDDTLSQDVKAAYTAFRSSTGKTIDVPIQPLMQTYGDVVDRFADKIPAAVKSRIESFTMNQGGQQSKVFDLEEADKLLKLLNDHYDPMNKAGNLALGEIKATLTQTLDSMANANAQTSNQLLKTAIGKARDRFELHRQIPALQDASFGNTGAQEKFVRDYVLGSGASVDQVGALMQKLDPDAVKAVQGAVRYQILREAAKGAERGADTAVMSQNALNDSLNRIGDRKLAAIFGPEEAAKMRNVQYVAALIQKEPFGAMPNRSGTTAALANLLQSRFLSLPGLNIVRDSTKKAIDEQTARNALQAIIQPANPTPNPADANKLRAIAQTFGVPLGGAAGVQATK